MEEKLAQERLDWLLKQLENAADTIDGPDGEPQPNTAMAILSDYEGWLQEWIK